ncbi:MAG: ATP-binding protein [Acidimicrobiales bacterium]
MGLDPGVQAATFLPTAASTGEARHYATRVLQGWALPVALTSDVALCVSELAVNAALHTRAAFTVTLRPAGLGVRVDVIDSRPEQLPVVAPRVGTVVDLTERSTTGRGLQIVATLADRWGTSTTNGAKAVWAELSGKVHSGPKPPIIVLTHQPMPAPGQRVHLLDLPVRAAVASGIQTDEAAREVQLAELARPTTETPQARLLELLDDSARMRLAGRYAAMRAAAEERDRFDLELRITDESMRAVAELADRLGSSQASSLPPPGPEIQAFRRWLSEETIRQRRGHEPRPCPLPS